MVAGGFGPYHCLWPDDAPRKRIVVTPTSGGMIGAVGLVVPTPKPCLLPYYLQTMRLKDFLWVDQLATCPDIIELALLTPLLTPRNSPPISVGVRGCLIASIHCRIDNQLRHQNWIINIGVIGD